MYVPPHFAETGEAELHRIIRGYPLGILITGLPDGLDANHIPFELDLSSGPHGTLHGHVARANPVWQQASSGSEVLVVFRGADGLFAELVSQQAREPSAGANLELRGGARPRHVDGA